jgi:flagellar biosynthetic protein FliQ
MTPDVVQLARETLVVALLLAAPVLLVATVVSLLINVAQVMTSIQEHTVATVPNCCSWPSPSLSRCLGCCGN